ncbi:structural protein [Dyella sp.]|uniref:structural protein n=1 Tax=Dyella sp. TaxID=1869338 RepID=UPI002FDA24A4
MNTPDLRPRGVRNNNPGNLEKGQKWQGLAPASQQTDPRFCVFTAPEWGIRAIGVCFQTYQRREGLKTLRQMISRWAPDNENDTDGYVQDVARRTGEDPDKPINVLDLSILKGIVLAIIWHENGEQPYSQNLIDQAIALVVGG